MGSQRNSTRRTPTPRKSHKHGPNATVGKAIRQAKTWYAKSETALKNNQGETKTRKQQHAEAMENFNIPDEQLMFDASGNIIGVTPRMGEGWACEYFYTPDQQRMLRVLLTLLTVTALICLVQAISAPTFMNVLTVLVALGLCTNIGFRTQGLSVAGKTPMPEIPFLMGVLDTIQDTLRRKTRQGIREDRKSRLRAAKQRGVDVEQFEGVELPLVLYPEKSKIIGGVKVFSPGTLLMHWMNDNRISETDLCELSNGKLDLSSVEGLLSNDRADWTDMSILKALGEAIGDSPDNLARNVDHYIGDEL